MLCNCSRIFFFKPVFTAKVLASQPVYMSVDAVCLMNSPSLLIQSGFIKAMQIVTTLSMGVMCCATECLQSMLRGRGGCYKHSFYGIESHRCMETTPSLACANKCVFCWRHHSNPVGTEWRWKMDPPEQILQEALENHHNMIRQFRGELSM
jgi:hypothetical protein